MQVLDGKFKNRNPGEYLPEISRGIRIAVLKKPVVAAKIISKVFPVRILEENH